MKAVSSAIAFLLVCFLTALLASCGGSNSSVTPPSNPAFSSLPGSSAAEGTPYTYSLVATAAGEPVTFVLTTAPEGATLSGNTVTWTPTAAQSRGANNFVVTAKTAAGGSATQAWTVTPNGTVRVSRVDTLWNQDGSRQQVFNWSRVAAAVVALVPQADGTFQTLTGKDAGNGEFDIANVPAGYYWLKLSPFQMYWTSSSAIDLGVDLYGRTMGSVGTDSTTTFHFSFTTPAPVANSVMEVVLRDSLPYVFAGTTSGGTTVNAGGAVIDGNVDYSLFKNAFALQYDPAVFGSVNGFVLGPALTMTNLSLVSGAVNNVTGTLDPAVPAMMNVQVKGSAWPELMNHVAPTAVDGVGGFFDVAAQPYSTNRVVNGPQNIELLWTPWMQFAGPNLPFGNCADTNSLALGVVSLFSGGSPPASFNADIDAGAVQYSDPFPASWLREFRVCEWGTVSVPIPGTTATDTITLTNGQATALPTGMVTPILSPVQSPKINGSDFFSPQTISGSAGVTVSWSAPAIGTPFGYRLLILTPVDPNTPTLHPVYGPGATLYTAKTAITLPPGVVASGNSYVFVVTALLNGGANMETSPNRSMLPTARADVISAAVTVE